MSSPMDAHILEFRTLLAKWEHGEITLEELYERLKNKFSEQ